MNAKPVTPALHGVNDYILSGILLGAPHIMRLNKDALKTYGTLAAGFAAINAATDTPAGLKRVLSFKTHQKADAAFLGGLSLLAFVSFIRKDKKALRFHLLFLATAVTHYVLTDYNAGSR